MEVFLKKGLATHIVTLHVHIHRYNRNYRKAQAEGDHTRDHLVQFIIIKIGLRQDWKTLSRYSNVLFQYSWDKTKWKNKDFPAQSENEGNTEYGKYSERVYEKLLGNVPKHIVQGLKFWKEWTAKGHAEELWSTIEIWWILMKPSV